MGQGFDVAGTPCVDGPDRYPGQPKFVFQRHHNHVYFQFKTGLNILQHEVHEVLIDQAVPGLIVGDAMPDSQ